MKMNLAKRVLITGMYVRGDRYIDTQVSMYLSPLTYLIYASVLHMILLSCQYVFSIKIRFVS